MAPFSLSRALSLVVGATAILGLVACGGGEDEGAAPAATVREQKPLPEEPLVARMDSVGTYGGRFVLGETSGPKTFNAMMANETSSTDITDNMFVGLGDFDNETQEDDASARQELGGSADGLTWTFHLRKGAAFSDGHPITSADVLFSFEIAYDDTLHPSVQDLLVMNGKKWDVSAPDDYTSSSRRRRRTRWSSRWQARCGSCRSTSSSRLTRAATFASAYNVSTPPDEIVDERTVAREAVRARREDGARAEPVLVRRGRGEPAPALPRRARLPRWCRIRMRPT